MTYIYCVINIIIIIKAGYTWSIRDKFSYYLLLCVIDLI